MSTPATTPAHAGRSLWVELPVADVERSRAFFAALGFGFDPRFTGEGAACMPVGEQAVVMLVDRGVFGQFAHRPVGDPMTYTQAICCFGVSSREEVDAVVDAALAAGAAEADGPEEHGPVYSRSFHDLDGHPWQIMWMDPSAEQPTGTTSAAQAGASA